MQIVDVRGLTPLSWSSHPDWSNVLRTRYPGARLVTADEAYGALRLLSGGEDEAGEVWGDVTVITTAERFPFWRLAHPRVVVEDYSGKKMSKTIRTTDPLHWAAGLVTGSVRKPDVTKLIKVIQAGNDKARERQVTMMQVQLATAPLPFDTVVETEGEYEYVGPDRMEEIWSRVAEHIRIGGWVGWDCETDQAGEEDLDAPNPYTANLVGVSVSILPKHAWYFPVNAERGKEFENPVSEVVNFVRSMYLWAKRTESTTRFLLHNCKYDYSVLANPKHDVPIAEVYGDWLPRTHDTMIMAALLGLPARLKKLAPQLLGVTPLDFKQITGGDSFSKVPLDVASVYAGGDADWPLRLWPLMWDMAQGWDEAHEDVNIRGTYQREMALIEMFMRMERRGIRIHKGRLQTHHWRVEEQLTYVDRGFRKAANEALRWVGATLPEDFNIGSSQQVGWLFYDMLDFPVTERTASGAPSTAEKALNKMMAEGFRHPLIYWLIGWRESDTRLKLLIRNLWKQVAIQPDGRVRASFHQVGAGTGRSSCSDPNLQQFYKALRKVVIPADGGEMAAIDYSQVELRVLAAIHGEEKMLEVYRLPRYIELEEQPPYLRPGFQLVPKQMENKAADIHGKTQDEVGLPSRTKAKNFNFGVAFGAEAPTLSEQCATPLAVTQGFLKRFWDAYGAYAASLKAMKKRDLERGFTTTWAGRMRPIETGSERERRESERKIANTPVQGGALDIAKDAGIALLPLLREYEQHGIYCFNFVHDEFDFECEGATPPEIWHEFLVKAQEIMRRTHPFEGVVPIDTDVEVGPSWGEQTLVRLTPIQFEVAA